VPFDPIPIDEVDAELPQDLAALGQQLRDDAAWLAARYPANSRDAAVAVASRRSFRWIHAAAAALVVAAGIGFVLATRPPADVRRPVTVDRIVTSQADGLPQSPSAEISDRVLDASEAYFLAADTNSAAGLIVPAVLFHNLSGPEQEGLLDLLDEIVPEAIDLSM
jgi:hypothetical protein